MDEPLLGGDNGVATLTSTTMNLLDNFVNVAIVSLPWCLAQGGYILGLVTLGVSALLTLVGFEVLVEACEVTGIRNYYGLAKNGMRGGYAVEICRTLYLLGMSLTITILVIDALLGSGTGLAPALLGIGKHENLATRLAASGIFHGCVTLPLALYRTLEGFKHIASVAVATVFYVVAVVVVRAFVGDSAGMPPGVTSLGGLAGVVPTINYMYNAHYNLPKYYDELTRRTPGRMRQVAIVAALVATAIYALIGVAGIYAFGKDVSSNVLLNFGPNNIFAITARAIILVCAATTIGKILLPLRDAFARLLAPFDEVVQLRGADALPLFPHHVALTTILCLVMVVFGSLLSTYGFGVVVAYNSAILGTVISYILPAIFWATAKKISVADSIEAAATLAPLPGKSSSSSPDPPSSSSTYVRSSFVGPISCVGWGTAVAALFLWSQLR